MKNRITPCSQEIDLSNRFFIQLKKKMTYGLKEQKNMHYFCRAMNIHFCLTRILLHAHSIAELEVQEGIFGSRMKTRDMEDA
jgi:hypothetical protein